MAYSETILVDPIEDLTFLASLGRDFPEAVVLQIEKILSVF